MSRVKPKVGDEVFWEDDTGKLQKGTVGGVDKSEVLLMETYTWEKTSSFINPNILKAKLGNAKKVIHDIGLVNDRKKKARVEGSKESCEMVRRKSLRFRSWTLFSLYVDE